MKRQISVRKKLNLCRCDEISSLNNGAVSQTGFQLPKHAPNFTTDQSHIVWYILQRIVKVAHCSGLVVGKICFKSPWGRHKIHIIRFQVPMCQCACNKLITHYPWNQSNNNNNQSVMMSQTGFRIPRHTLCLYTTKSWFHFWWTDCSSIRKLPNRVNQPKIKCIQQSEKI